MLKAITFDFWQTLYADSDKNWRKRQAIRVKRCHTYLSNCGYTCTLTDVEFGLEEAYNLVSSLWYKHRGISVKRCMERFAEVLQLQLQDADLDQLRRMLAMAIGRARKSVMVGYKLGEESSLIGLLDPATYDLVKVPTQ